MLHRHSLIALITSILAAGCAADDGGLPCAAPVDLSCAPAYEPTFEKVHENTLTKRCALAGGACHSAEGAQGGLVLGDIEAAYAGLVGDGRIDAASPECSMLLKRISAPDAADSMPPGGALSAAEQCAVGQWIANGAER